MGGGSVYLYTRAAYKEKKITGKRKLLGRLFPISNYQLDDALDLCHRFLRQKTCLSFSFFLFLLILSFTAEPCDMHKESAALTECGPHL